MRIKIFFFFKPLSTSLWIKNLKNKNKFEYFWRNITVLPFGVYQVVILLYYFLFVMCLEIESKFPSRVEKHLKFGFVDERNYEEWRRSSYLKCQPECIIMHKWLGRWLEGPLLLLITIISNLNTTCFDFFCIGNQKFAYLFCKPI